MAALKPAAFRATVFIVAILLILYIALLATINAARFQEWLKLELAQRTGYQITAQQLWLDPWLRLNLSAATVVKDSIPVLQAERISLVLTPAALFSRSIHRLRLEKPVLHLALSELMQGRREAAQDFTIRHLNIADGALVLKLEDGQALDFRSLAMNAENVNLGYATGLNLRAHIPWLDGVAQIVVTGDETAKLATLRVEQPPGKTLTGVSQPEQRRSAALEAQIKLSKRDDASIDISAAGKVNNMIIEREKFSGHFDARARLGAQLPGTDIEAKIVATELPSQTRFLPVALPGGTTTLDLEGTLSMADKQLAVRTFRLQSPLGEAGGTGRIDFSPEISVAHSKVNLRKVGLEPLRPLLPDFLSALAPEGFLDADLEVRGARQSVALRGTVQGAGIRLRSEQFSVTALSFKTPVEWTGSSFRAGDLRIAARKLLARQKSAMPVSAEELRIDGTWEAKVNEPVKATGEIRIDQGRFASTDGTRIGENLVLSGRFEMTRQGESKETSVAGKLEIERGEMLWGKFFGDLKSRRPALQFDGAYAAATDALRVRQLNFALAGIGRLAARGDIEHPSNNPLLRLEINSDDFQAAGFYEFFIRQTLRRSFPLLDQLAVAGRLAFAVKAQGDLDNLLVEGAMQLRGGEIRNKAKQWHLGPMRLDLPLRIHYPGASVTEPALNAPTGSLAIESATFGSERIPAIRTTLSLWNNTLRFHQPVRLPIYGGSLEISDLAFAKLIEDPQAVALSLGAKNLQLQRLTEALGWYRFGGTLSGSIPKIEWDGGSLRSQGQIQVNVFGGTVQISKLEIESPFSSVPSIKLDALFRDISLDQASKTFAFGQISGILEGTVEGLVLTAGQPSEFRADVRSVEKRGVSQRISVESLNKITVLSSGSDAGSLYGGIAGFFDSFRYSQLGFKAALKNDKLTLRGVESRKDGEYLVVGSLLPPTVNVVSHTQSIGFSELLRRLERIQQAEKPEKAAN
jgi:hypothetical protein